MLGFSQRSNTNSGKIIVIDGMNIFHRAYHVNKFMSNANGIPTGGAFGMINMLLGYSRKFETNRFVIAWDGGKLWRQKVNKDYKRKRKEAQAEIDITDIEAFNEALAITQDLFSRIGILQIKKLGFEADDIIALASYNADDIVIVSNDKDLLQLVNDKRKVRVLRDISRKSITLMKERDACEVFKVRKVSDIKLYLALAGDSGDGVKGVFRIGDVKARELITTGAMDSRGRIRETLTEKQLKEFENSYILVSLSEKMMKRIFKKPLSENDLINSSLKFDAKMVQSAFDEYDMRTLHSYSIMGNLYRKGFGKEFLQVINNGL